MPDRFTSPFSIGNQPEELLRAGDGIGVRTHRAGKIAERAGEGGRGLQTKSCIGPTQQHVIFRQLNSERNAQSIFGRRVLAITPGAH